ncbi:MAG: hypothetical protein K8T91_12925 [Planctomycetes bacterium]|nr:hypothetical protein [Planctomycetota bacterium]
MKSRAQIACIGVKRVSSDKSETGQFFFGVLAFGRFNSGEFILPDDLGAQLVPLKPTEENPVVCNVDLELTVEAFADRNGKSRNRIGCKLVGGELAPPQTAATARRSA